MKKYTVLAAGALLASLTLVGCGVGSTSSSTGGASASSAAGSSSSSSASSYVPYDDSTYTPSSDTVKLTIWGGELAESQEWLNKMVTGFKAKYPLQNFEFTVGAISESKVKDEWTKDPENAADFAIAADDQVYDLAKNGYIQDISKLNSKLAADVEYRNSTASVAACQYSDDLYAFPVSASNGFFLYYNSSLLSATDVDTFDGMMAAIKAKSIADGKTYQFGFPSTSGWYLDGWFRAAGLNVAMGSDGLNTCDWNRTTPSPTGVDVAGALVSLANGDYKNYWKAASDSDCVVATATGGSSQVIATINGTWSAKTITANYGTGAAATILPSYKIGTESYRMKSVVSHKVGIVNSYSDNLKWASYFANYVTNTENQISRYDDLTEAPTNTEAVSKVDLTSNYAVAALAQQTGSYGFVESVAKPFWTPTETLDGCLNAGVNGTDKLIENGVLNTTNIQTLLDTTVAAVKLPESTEA